MVWGTSGVGVGVGVGVDAVWLDTTVLMDIADILSQATWVDDIFPGLSKVEGLVSFDVELLVQEDGKCHQIAVEVFKSEKQFEAFVIAPI